MTLQERVELVRDLQEWIEIAKEDESAKNQYTQGFSHGMQYLANMLILTYSDTERS